MAHPTPPRPSLLVPYPPPSALPSCPHPWHSVVVVKSSSVPTAPSGMLTSLSFSLRTRSTTSTSSLSLVHRRRSCSVHRRGRRREGACARRLCMLCPWRPSAALKILAWLPSGLKTTIFEFITPNSRHYTAEKCLPHEKDTIPEVQLGKLLIGAETGHQC